MKRVRSLGVGTVAVLASAWVLLLEANANANANAKAQPQLRPRRPPATSRNSRWGCRCHPTVRPRDTRS